MKTLTYIYIEKRPKQNPTFRCKTEYEITERNFSVPFWKIIIYSIETLIFDGFVIIRLTYR